MAAFYSLRHLASPQHLLLCLIIAGGIISYLKLTQEIHLSSSTLPVQVVSNFVWERGLLCFIKAIALE